MVKLCSSVVAVLHQRVIFISFFAVVVTFFNFIHFCMLQRRCMKVCTNKVAYSTGDSLISVHLISCFTELMSTSGVWCHRAGFALC